jgi:glycosyltransferase involved in cell wall biosynthesis
LVEALQATGVGAVATKLPYVLRSLHTFNPDILQGWMYHGNLVATAAAPMCGGRLYWGIRQSLGALDRERPATNRLIRFGARLSRRPSSIVYNSERARVDHEALGYARASGRVIANGFDTNALRPDDLIRRQARHRLGLAERDVLIGHLARYHPIKDHATFIASIARIGAGERRIRVVMAGRDVDESNPELREAIERFGLGDTISLLGEVPAVSALLPALDVLCLSSRSEALPNVLGEAMSCGIPCVTTDVGDAAKLVGNTGWIVPPGNVDRLAEALRTAAALDGDIRRERGGLARRRVVDHFSLESVIAQYAQLYEGGAVKG